MIRIRKKSLTTVSFIYIYIPVIIFLVGWTKAYIWLPVLAVLGYVAYRAIRALSSENEFSVDARFLVAGIIFLLFVGCFSGWGRWTKQSFDWYKHNAVLSDLIEKPWPVYYVNGNEKSMLSYYVGQYLVPAVSGKITRLLTDARMTVSTFPLGVIYGGTVDGNAGVSEFIAEIPVSFRVAEIVQFFWNEIGLLLVWMNLMLFMKLQSIKAHIVELFLLAFFSVPQSLVEIIVYFVYGLDFMYKNYIVAEDGEIMLQYTGNYLSLIGAFAQVLVPWLVVVIFLNNKDNIRIYLFYMLPLLLFAPFSLVGLVPIAMTQAVYRYCKDNNKIDCLRKIFSIENLACLFSLGSVMFLYLYGNITEPKPDILTFRFMHYGSLFGIYIVFILINVLLYAAYAFCVNRKDPLYYVCVAELIVLPLFCMGYFNDLNLRTSVPALFILMCMLIQCVTEGYAVIREKKALSKIIIYLALLAILINGASYQFQKLGDRVIGENYLQDANLYTYGTMEYFADRGYDNMSDTERKNLLIERHPDMDMSQDFTVDLVYNYYSYDIEDNVFYKYLAGKIVGEDGEGANE